MIALVILILLAGMIVFWIGFSTSLGASGQTGADAAALAGEQAVVNYFNTSPTAVLDSTTLDGVACGAARNYATLNHVHVTNCQVVSAANSGIGYDTEVWAATDESLPAGSPDAGQSANARARASTDPFSQSSPAVTTSVSYTCDASLVSGPVFSGPPSGNSGFFPAAGTNYTYGCEPKLAGALDELGQAKQLHLQGASGYVAQSQGDSGVAAAVAHGCGDASTTPGLQSVPDSVLRNYGLIRPFASQRDLVELAGVSCDQQAASVDSTTSGSVGLGNMNVHLVPFDQGGPAGQLPLPLFGSGGVSIGENALQVACQIYDAWKIVNTPPQYPQDLLFVTLLTAQTESTMGQNIGPNRTDPNQSVGVFQQQAADGWGTIPQELNVTESALIFLRGAHTAYGSAEGLLDVYAADPTASPWALAQGTQHSGTGQSTDGAGNYGNSTNWNYAKTYFAKVTSGGCPAG